MTGASSPPATHSSCRIAHTAHGRRQTEPFGIWQATSTAPVFAGGSAIPHQPGARETTANFQNREDDPVNNCYMPGTPRIIYGLSLPDFPDAQRARHDVHVDAIYRLIYTDGSPHETDVPETRMGDSRGRWEDDTMVVDVSNYNNMTWFDAAGDFHSEALHVVERYRMTDPDTIRHEATIEDRRSSRSPDHHRGAAPARRQRPPPEYHCCRDRRKSGAFTEKRGRVSGRWDSPRRCRIPLQCRKPGERHGEHSPDGGRQARPAGFYESKTAGANQGLQRQGRRPGVIVDPADGKLPLLPWAAEETLSRNLPERGYDDPTAHCFPAGVPRSMYVPAAIHIIQTPEYIVFLHERMSWRIGPLNGRPHIPDSIRLWQGDSVGHWEATRW
jgi:hypothetical protein